MAELTDADLDRMVAERVMGWEYAPYMTVYGIRGGYIPVDEKSVWVERDVSKWNPTANLNDAGLALMALMARQIDVRTLYNEDAHLWTVNILPVEQSWPRAIGLAGELPKALTIAMLDFVRLTGEE